jgi:hypothetical protein
LLNGGRRLVPDDDPRLQDAMGAGASIQLIDDGCGMEPRAPKQLVGKAIRARHARRRRAIKSVASGATHNIRPCDDLRSTQASGSQSAPG